MKEQTRLNKLKKEKAQLEEELSKKSKQAQDKSEIHTI